MCQVRRFLAAAMLLLVGLISAGPARAEATVVRFSGTHTETFAAPLEGCLPEDLVGTVTLTETFTVQVVDTGKNVFIASGVNEYDYHGEFPDGSYVQSGINREHFAFVLNGAHTVFNSVGQDFRTIYASDGMPVGTLSIHEEIHVTYDDLNGNETPDPGEISAEFDYFHLRCG
jgi:hypothetical protein